MPAHHPPLTHPCAHPTRAGIRELLTAASEHVPPLVMVGERAAALNAPAAYPAPLAVTLRALHVVAALALLRRYLSRMLQKDSERRT
jgi:membrane protein implicated in regulation of membrane protease activity